MGAIESCSQVCRHESEGSMQTSIIPPGLREAELRSVHILPTRPGSSWNIRLTNRNKENLVSEPTLESPVRLRSMTRNEEEEAFETMRNFMTVEDFNSPTKQESSPQKFSPSRSSRPDPSKECRIQIQLDTNLKDANCTENVFFRSIAEDLAQAASCKSNKIRVVDMQKHPLTLTVVLEDGICPHNRSSLDVARDLRMQSLESSSKLLNGKFTRHVQLFQIMTKENVLPLHLNISSGVSSDRGIGSPVRLQEAVIPEWKPVERRHVTP
eukprot:747923-Hanusia_phi.AAC.3